MVYSVCVNAQKLHHGSNGQKLWSLSHGSQSMSWPPCLPDLIPCPCDFFLLPIHFTTLQYFNVNVQSMQPLPRNSPIRLSGGCPTYAVPKFGCFHVKIRLQKKVYERELLNRILSKNYYFKFYLKT